MCGFLGCFEADLNLAHAMSPLSHRGPDSEDEYQGKNLFLRHFRLAIIGSETAARQPMISFDGRVVIAYNGEIYNYRELARWMGRSELAELGDTRVLVEFLATYGLERLDLLNGMFAIAVYFEDSENLYLVRDRFGIKPLYYLKDHGIYFASEIKSLRSVKALSLNRNRLIDYLEYASYPSGIDTAYNNIVQVDAGTWVKYGKAELETCRWYDFRSRITALQEAPLSIDGYEALVEDSIKLRLRSDVPVSLHYSAGTDSTALLLKVKESWGWDFPLTAFTMAFEDPAVDESALAQTYCDQIDVKNHRVYLTAEEVPGLAEELHRFTDEPYGGVPTIAYYKMNRVEREQGFIVSIEGQGGDEAFGGYLYHVYLAIFDLHLSGHDPDLLRLILQVHGLELREAVKAAQKLIEAGFQSHTDMTDLRGASASPVDKFIDWLRTIQLYDIFQNKIPRTLRFNDRASMANGREVRFPLLDHRVLEYAVGFSHGIKYQGGHSKAPLREIIRRHLPGAYDAPKRSVVTPQTRWFQGELKSWVLERTDVLRECGHIPAGFFNRVDEFYAEPAPTNSFALWQLINLSYFIENF